MNLDEFLAELKALGLKWHFNSGSYIRCERGDCPLLALYHSKGGSLDHDNCHYGIAGKALRIDEYTDIIGAADGSYDISHRLYPIREQLLEATGLKS